MAAAAGTMRHLEGCHALARVAHRAHVVVAAGNLVFRCAAGEQSRHAGDQGLVLGNCNSSLLEANHPGSPGPVDRRERYYVLLPGVRDGAEPRSPMLTR